MALNQSTDHVRPSGKPKIGIVLGAGGVLGGAWMAGGLAALNRVTGWDPREADYLVGTSAGAVFAALLAAGVSPEDFVPSRAANGRFRQPWILSELVLESSYKPRSWIPRLPLGSWRLATEGILQGPGPWSVLKFLSGIAPTGTVSVEPIIRTVRRIAGSGCIAYPNCRIVATNYQSGERTVFGADVVPEVGFAEAVAASCAVPGFFEPVSINGQRYVDGGIHSFCNLDLLDGTDLDLIICFSTLTSKFWRRGTTPLQRAIRSVMRAAAKQLDDHVNMLASRGVEVVVLEPTSKDCAAMGSNLMDTRRCRLILEVGLKSVAERLGQHQVRVALQALNSAA